MKAMKGKTLDLGSIYNFFNYVSNSSQHNGPVLPFLMRLRLFSSMDGDPDRGKFRKPSFNDHDIDDGEKFSGRNDGNLGFRRNFSPNHGSGRPLRGERHMPRSRRENVALDRNKRGGRNDGFHKPFGGDDFSGRRENTKNIDDFVKFDGGDGGRVNGGLGGNDEVKKDARPSISEILNRPLKGGAGKGEEGSVFLEKFKLSGVGKKENQPAEAKLEPSSEEEKIEVPEDADVIFKKMKQTGLIPNAVAMLDGLCKDGLIQEAMKLFGLMREKGTMPEVVVYTAVVEGFCQAQKLDDATRIFRKMQSNGIVPNAFSYAVIIKGLCRGKRLESAVDFCVEMLEAGHMPNVVTFTGVVHEFCKKGVDEAQKIIVTLKQKGFLLDEKAVRDYLDKTGPTSPMVWEAIFGPKKTSQRTF